MVRTNTHNQGLALILTLVTVSAIITITVSMIGLSLQQLQLSVDARDSERAFHAASAGLECGQYLHNKEVTQFLSYDPDEGDEITLDCMGQTDDVAGISVTPDGNIGTINQFFYSITPTFAGRTTCVEIDISILESPDNESMNHDFHGQVGEVECAQSSVCTVVVSRGYNRGCTAPPSGGYEVLRELNAIF